MKISITIPNDKVNEVIEALCSVHGYSKSILVDPIERTYIPNPLTKAQFAKKAITDMIKKDYKKYKVGKLSNIKAIESEAELYTDGIS